LEREDSEDSNDDSCAAYSYEDYYEDLPYEDWYLEKEEEFDDKLYNRKRGGVVVRNQASHKKEKISNHRVNAIRHTRKQRQLEIARLQIARHKANSKFQVEFFTAIKVSNHPSYRPPSSSSTALYQKQQSAVSSYVKNQHQPSSRPRNHHRNADDVAIQIALDASRRELQRVGAQAFSSTQINDLASLLTRDLTPEDYELLLLLDSTVRPKTLSAKEVAAFPTKVIDSDEETQDRCTICMVNYEKGDKAKKLPCGHMFHEDCVTTWFTNSSVKCPLDGLAVSST